ncbi:NADH dehydrogenase subunit J [Modestobacter italicus]|uniref:NADH-quinone oxidoreductase subunit J n=1 Tax=Modestobacter italicus (strain DSM 44449 / CECT 9708 / BC 501) TaxID=2732864 RepID=I4F3X8_MODI5|nr:NADH-quinone oxidoreductase subunit J [Modestobacter marinus]CCH90341.1 NADH dehydrogenase subunit J [Modestobacter marinus]
MSVLAAAADTGVQIGTGEAIVFWVLGPIALAGALGMVLSKNAVHSALWLVNTMLALGVLYVVQEAPFLGAVQIIVYTGAIMILFLFVLMLVGRDTSDSVVETLRGQRVAAIVLGIGFAGLVGAGIAEATQGTPVTGLEGVQGGAGGAADGNVQAIAELLFTRYLLAFEVTSALLITAAVGAMVLAHTEREPGTRQSQKELSRARFLSGDHPQTLPGPGVYARANSIAAPGRLPDGSPATASFSTGVEPQVVDELPPTGSTGAEREGLGHAGGTDAALGTNAGGRPS